MRAQGRSARLRGGRAPGPTDGDSPRRRDEAREAGVFVSGEGRLHSATPSTKFFEEHKLLAKGYLRTEPKYDKISSDVTVY